MDLSRVCAVMPALDEEGSIAQVVRGLLARGVGWVVVADNGSQDRTAALAQDAGARVVHASRRGYGSACLVALAALPQGAQAVLFCDADGADDLDACARLCAPVLSGQADLVIGSRVLGQAAHGALTLPQRCGNLVASTLLALLFRCRVTDLGPFRCMERGALARLAMADPGYGWTAEMQTKALRLGLRYAEIPVNAKVRLAGQSKISGRLIPVLRAGWAILSTILRYRLCRLSASEAAWVPPLAATPRSAAAPSPQETEIRSR